MPQTVKLKKHHFFILLYTFLSTLPLTALSEINLSWDANSESDLAGYRLYYSLNSPVTNSASFVSVGNVTKYDFSASAQPGVNPGDTIYFALTAVDFSNNESGFSNQISAVDSVSTPGDSDSDGLSDSEENALGTDPSNPDSDNDGVLDGQEVTDGTDPLDKGSVLPLLNTTLCTEWNGFFSMWNILEHVNLSNSPLEIVLTFYDIAGTEKRNINFSLPPGAQYDALVHDFEDRVADSYGKVCSSHNGSAGDLDGRMVHYRPDLDSAERDFEFAFAMPMTNGIKGKQFVGFNTFQPSLDPADASNLVANWIQLTNLSNSTQSGRLTFYDMSGGVLGALDVLLQAGARRDISAHQFGASLVGLVSWDPADKNIGFQLRNIRYLYDNPSSYGSFTTAFQLEGAAGSGRLLSAALDTAGASSILEVANTTGSEVSAEVSFYDVSGNLLHQEQVDLAAYTSRHMIADHILNGGRGIVTVDGNARGSILATVMQYARNGTGGINYMYGVRATQARGAVLRGSYNTYLGQTSELWIVNPSDSQQTATLSMLRSDRTTVVSSEEVIVPANGLSIVNLNEREEASNYGVVTIQTTNSNSIVATIIRRKGSEFAIPTPVRQ